MRKVTQLLSLTYQSSRASRWEHSAIFKRFITNKTSSISISHRKKLFLRLRLWSQKSRSGWSKPLRFSRSSWYVHLFITIKHRHTKINGATGGHWRRNRGDKTCCSSSRRSKAGLRRPDKDCWRRAIHRCFVAACLIRIHLNNQSHDSYCWVIGKTKVSYYLNQILLWNFSSP